MTSHIEQQRFMCAIGGMQTVVAIPRAVPILHSGPGCGNMVAGFFERSTGYAGGSTAPCTNFSETEVVFGGEKRLESIIRNTYKVLDTDLQVVLTGCTSAIVGDDAGSVTKKFADQGKPIVYVDTPGFKCSNFASHDLIVNEIIDQYVDRFAYNNAEREPNLVNLFATIPFQDQFWKGNLEEFKRILEGIGLKVNVLFGPYSRGVEEWKTIPRAGFNIVVSPWYGLKIARHLEDKYGTPYYNFPYLPIGGNETTRFLRGVAEFAGLHGAKLQSERVERFIASEEYAFYEEIDSLATFLLEFRYGLPGFVHILHDSSYVVGMNKFLLHETGIVPKEQFITEDVPEEYQDAIRSEIAGISDKREIPVFFEPDAGLAQRTIYDASHEGRGLIIGSGWDKQLAQDKHYDFLSAALPSPYRLALTTRYAGYKGGLRLIEDIYDKALDSYN
jgi:nitrogenase molybdenum-iron protein beta chain